MDFKRFAVGLVLPLIGCDLIDRPKLSRAVLEESARLHEAVWDEAPQPEKLAVSGEQLRCAWEALVDAGVDPRADFECLRLRTAAAADCYEKQRKEGTDLDAAACMEAYEAACEVSSTYAEIARDTCPRIEP